MAAGILIVEKSESYGKENDLVVYQTDKSGRFSVDSCENYKLSCQEHIINDQVITLEEYKEIEKNANFHAKTWARISQAGSLQRDAKRIKENLIINDTQPPPLYTCRKDHKETEDEVVGPPTRPICGVVDSATDRLSYVLSTVLNEIWKRNTETVCMSTEELKAEIENVNRNISGRDIVVGSMDVKALYPSLDIPFTVRTVSKIIEKSQLQLN